MNKRFNLYQFRVKKGLTQVQFAEKMGFSPCYYSLVENGIRDGSMQFWGELQKFYEVPDDQMYSLMKIG